MKKFKSLLTGILLSIIGLCSFTNAEKITVQYVSDGNFYPGYCYSRENGIWEDIVAYNENGVSQGVVGNSRDKSYQTMYCFSYTGYFLTSNGNSIASVYGDNLPRYIVTSSCPACEECQECQECPAVDTGAILSGYIAISDITTNYCVSNDLCPEMSGGNSALYINDIRHESMPFINLRIPEEIERTYNYTGNGTQLDISVEGYGYDQEKMQSMVNTQYYTPTSEEMSNLVGKIADFLPLIAIALLIVWIRRVLKKVFRF